MAGFSARRAGGLGGGDGVGCWWYIWFLIGSARALFHYIRASLAPPGVGSFFCCAGQALFWERFSVLLNGAWVFIHSWRHDSGDMCGVVRLP